MLDAEVILVDPAEIPTEEVGPGRGPPAAGRPARRRSTSLGVLVGRAAGHADLGARRPGPASTCSPARSRSPIRNAQLFGQVEAQNAQLLELDAAKDDFLRGVSHNLQTPLTSIRAYAEQLAIDRPDQRLGIIAEQSERLSRMVRQLLTVTRLESGALHPRSEVVSLATRVRKAWEALGAADVAVHARRPMPTAGWPSPTPTSSTRSCGRCSTTRVKYGGRRPSGRGGDRRRRRRRRACGSPSPTAARASARPIGRGCSGGSCAARSAPPTRAAGSGLYVSRELCRAMGGDLFLEPPAAGRGAAFTIVLPAAEFAEEG